MMTIRTKARSISEDDSGMTLVEVIVAVIIIVIVALSGAVLSVNGITTASAQQRNQVAVTLANGAMESVSGWSVAMNANTGVSNVYTGRCLSDVNSAFSANSTQPGVSATYAVWDPKATLAGTCSNPSLPTTKSPTGTGTSYLAVQNGTSYTVYSIIGACYEPVTGGSCGLVAGYATPPSTTPAGYTAMMRAIVIVKWTAGKTCAASGCYYETTSLLDGNKELQWVTH